MLFPTTFISASEKTGLGLKKQAANFYFTFIHRMAIRYSCFDFFILVKNEGIFSYLAYEVLI